MPKGLIQFVFSAGVHLTLLTGILFLMAAPRPLASSTEVAVAVDVVTPEEVKAKQPDKPEPQPEATQQAAAAAPSPPASETPSTQVPTAESPPAQTQSTPVPQPTQEPAQEPPPRGASRFDQTAALLRYSSPLPASDFDARANQQAALTDDQIAAFKTRLKSCWLPEAGVAPASRTFVVLRVVLSIDGKLSAEPTLVEASAAADGPAIMRAAKNAVLACAPFSLPRERYDQWRVMDVRFSPAEMS